MSVKCLTLEMNSVITDSGDKLSRLSCLPFLQGPHWQHFGHQKHGKMLLQPHEALFLLEQVYRMSFGYLINSFLFF